MTETNLSNIWWQPHTCGCKLSYYKSETKAIEPAVSKYIIGQGESFQHLPEWQQKVIRLLVQKDDSIAVVRGRFETVVWKLKGLVSHVAQHLVHPFDEKPQPTGTRMRAQVVDPCPQHIDFNSPLQTQTVHVERVCRCRWIEIMIGEKHEGGKFGHRVIELCFQHAEVPFAEIPELVYEAGRNIPQIFDSSLRAEMRDGIAVMIYRDTEGHEHILTMERVSESENSQIEK